MHLFCLLGIVLAINIDILESTAIQKDYIGLRRFPAKPHNFRASDDISKIYSRYQKSSKDCRLGTKDDNLQQALDYANTKIAEYKQSISDYEAVNSNGLAFSNFISNATLQAKYNEFVTDYLGKNCVNSDGSWNDQQYCDLDLPNSNQVECNPNDKYRRLDGKCNNLENTNYASSFHGYRRVLPSDYADGVSAIRAASDGSDLPNPRVITNQYMPDLNNVDQLRNSLHMSLGQFIAHDTFKTLQYLGLSIDCCTPGIPRHPECLAIYNIPQDAVTTQLNQTCLGNVRSTTSNTCSLGPRNQMNAATSFLDLSHVYGGNLLANSSFLRTFQGGKLLSSKDSTNEDIMPVAVLPRDQDQLDLQKCNPPLNRPNLTCFLTGDGQRGNQQPFISALQVAWLRRHNQHTDAFHKVNPHWSDETLYQEARRLLIAEYTNIVYGEYIPSLIGQDITEYYGIQIVENGYTEYRSDVDASSIQAVGVAAFRLGHSQVQSLFNVINKIKENSYSMNLKDKYFEMSDIYDGNSNGLINGLMTDFDQSVDPYLVTDVSNFLFYNPRTPSVIDLPAINIQRGRDHGVPAYVYFLEYCNGYVVNTWDDLPGMIPQELVDKLKTIYKEVTDIDLFVGGLSERPLSGSALGPTFSCMIGIQFWTWKFGDRFYFEHQNQTGSFTEGQLKTIKKCGTLSNLICKTTDLEDVLTQPLLAPSESNSRISCNDLCEIDYNLWHRNLCKS